MRVNVYAEEMTDKLEIVSKTIDGQEFTGLRFYLYTPVTIPLMDSEGKQRGMTVHRGPFLHREGDDDSSAVTFWGKRDLRDLLDKAKKLLDAHYVDRNIKTQKKADGLLSNLATPTYYLEKEGEFWKDWQFGEVDISEFEVIRKHAVSGTVIINNIKLHALLFHSVSNKGIITKYRWDCESGWSEKPPSIEY